MKKIFRLSALAAFFGAPLMAVAQTGVNVSYLQNYSTGITGVINYILVPVLMAVAFIVFLYGVYKYFIQGAADEKSRTDGRQFTLWGVVGFVVILSLWGIVNIFMSTLGLSVGQAPAYPTIGNVGGSSVPGLPSSVYGTPAQNTTLVQQYSAWQSACGISSTSADCQAAQAAYSASYYSVNPNPSATIDNAQNTTVGAGADCTYSPCASGLTCGMSLGYPTCEATGVTPQTCPSGQEMNYALGECQPIYTPTSSVPGCTNSSADNYNPSATVDDGSCFYPL